MLYFVGLTPAQLPAFPINFNPVEFVIGRNSKTNIYKKKELSKKDRSTTPIDMILYFQKVIDIIQHNGKKNNYTGEKPKAG